MTRRGRRELGRRRLAPSEDSTVRTRRGRRITSCSPRCPWRGLGSNPRVTRPRGSSRPPDTDTGGSRLVHSIERPAHPAKGLLFIARQSMLWGRPFGSLGPRGGHAALRYLDLSTTHPAMSRGPDNGELLPRPETVVVAGGLGFAISPHSRPGPRDGRARSLRPNSTGSGCSP